MAVAYCDMTYQVYNDETSRTGSSPEYGPDLGQDRFFIWPSYIGFFILAMAGLCWAVGLPQEYAAAVILIFFAAGCALHPANGVSAIVLSVPFFLAPSSRPYIWMLDAMTWWVALIFIVRYFLDPRARGISSRLGSSPLALAWPAVWVALVAAMAFPLDIREFPIHLWTADGSDVFQWWLSSHPMTPAVYLRVVMDLSSGVLLFFAATAFFPTRDSRAAQSLFYTIAVTVVVMVVIGSLAMRKYILYDLGQWTYLGLSHSHLVAPHEAGMMAFAFNRQYFAIYTLLCAPMTMYFFLSWRRKAFGAAVSLALATVVILGLVQSGQRSPLAFFLAACAGWGYLYARSEKKKISAKAVVSLLLASALTLGAGLAFIGKDIGAGLDRFGWDHIRHDPRVYLWQVAGRMFADNPLLGVGTGRYTYRFYDFYDAGEKLPSGLYITLFNAEAHSLYFQILAEQGAIGILTWGLFLVMLFHGGWRFLCMDGPDPWRKRAVLTVMLSMLIWAGFAIFNNLFYVRAFGIYFWAAAGIMAALAYPALGNMAPYPPLRRAMQWALALAFIVQIVMAAVKPIPHYFATGFHGWESLGAGEKARWTTRKAAMKIDDFQGERLRLKVSAPLPGMSHPQKTVFWFGDETKEVELGGEWAVVDFAPGNRGAPEGMLWIRSEYMVNPKSAGFGEDGRDLGIYMMNITPIPHPGNGAE